MRPFQRIALDAVPGNAGLPQHGARRAVLGTLTTVQDWPGRQGYWAVGVPPSGPMDDRALRLGNRLLGNAEGAAGSRSRCRDRDCVFARPRWWRSPARGCRSCSMAPSSPWTRPCSCPLARRSRLALSGRGRPKLPRPARRPAIAGLPGQQEHLHPGPVRRSRRPGAAGRRCPAPADARRRLGRRQLAADVARPPAPRAPDPRDLRPHGAPEYFTAGYIETFFAAQWEVHFNSSRTGVRLIGPRRMGPRQRRGSRPASFQHPRQPVCRGAVDFTGTCR